MLDEIGIRCIPAAAARDLIATHRAAVQIARDRQRTEREAARQRPHPIRQRLESLHAAQERFEGADLPALAVMMANDVEASMNASSARMDELLTGDSYYHPINEKG